MRKNIVPLVIRQKIRINTLENENETLKSTIKDKLYKEFMNKLGEPMEIARIKKENQKLRKKNKQLKELIKEGLR